MNEKIKDHWKENIKPVIGIIFLGSLLVVGMRLAEMAWPEKAAKVYICFDGGEGIEACKIFKPKGS